MILYENTFLTYFTLSFLTLVVFYVFFLDPEWYIEPTWKYLLSIWFQNYMLPNVLIRTDVTYREILHQNVVWISVLNTKKCSNVPIPPEYARWFTLYIFYYHNIIEYNITVVTGKWKFKPFLQRIGTGIIL